MKNMTLSNIAKACHGTLHLQGTNQSKAKEATCVVTDSRKVEPGGIFIATRGQKVDGHTFISKVMDMGALGVICEEIPEDTKIPCIVVENSLQALKDVAKYYRSQLSIQVIGITGSVGKTSTKELIASVLSQKFCVLKTPGNFNNEVGLPLTVLSIRAEHEIAVLEMGISDFGEMHRLSEIARPDICVMTNIGQCHLENLKTREGILKAKSEIFDFMNPDGFVFVNGDDDLLSQIQLKSKHASIHFGTDSKNDIFASDIMNKEMLGTQITVHADLKVFSLDIPLPGNHMVYNALAAAGIGLKLGMKPEEIRNGIRAVEPVKGRGHIMKLADFTLMDDCYNANPASMKAAIQTLCYAHSRKVAILGDMFELGTNEAALHEEVGRFAVRNKIDVLVCAGTLSKHMVEAAESEMKTTGGSTKLYYFETRDEMLSKLQELLCKGDAILVKASHGMQFETVVEKIEKM